MRPYSGHLIRFAALVTALILSVGCHGTFVMRTDELAGLQTGSPLRGIASKTFALKEFTDARRTDPYMVFDFKGDKWKLEQPVTAFAAMAIRKELERNGHTCIAYSPASKADFIIGGAVFKYRIDQIYVGSFYAYVGVKVTINPASAGNRVLIKSYDGEAIGPGLPRGTWKEQLNRANSAMLKEFSNDPDLIEFLEK